MSQFTSIGRLEEFQRGQIRAFQVGRRSICAVRVGDRVLAFSNLCTHEYVELTYGYVMQGRVYCGQHDAAFDLETGEVVSGPAALDLRVYPTRIEGDVVLVSTGEDE